VKKNQKYYYRATNARHHARSLALLDWGVMLFNVQLGYWQQPEKRAATD
jgi:hypothetical protein